jgi:hypothetical protein
MITFRLLLLFFVFWYFHHNFTKYENQELFCAEFLEKDSVSKSVETNLIIKSLNYLFKSFLVI